jgi:MFS family permease
MTLPGKDPALVVILAGVSAALHVGKLSPALPILRDALHISLLQAGFLLSLVQLAGMALGLVVGLAADGIGLKRSLIMGLLILFGSGALGGYAQNATDLLALRALEGVGFLLVSMPAQRLRCYAARFLSVPSAGRRGGGCWPSCHSSWRCGFGRWCRATLRACIRRRPPRGLRACARRSPRAAPGWWR